MKRSITKKIFLAFLAIAVITSILSAAIFPSVIRSMLVKRRADRCYNSASALISDYQNAASKEPYTLDSLYQVMTALAQSEEVDIRMIEPDGTVVLASNLTFEESRQTKIDGFDFAAFGPKYYEVSTFFDSYKTEHMNVLVPVVDNMKTIAYFSMSEPMASIDVLVTYDMRIIFMVALLSMTVSILLFSILSFWMRKPMEEIIDGVNAVGAGNLTHRIDTKHMSEFKELGDTINLMATELEKDRDYQAAFLSNISHDFRSPLTSIKGYTDAMCDGTIPPEMYDRYLKIINSESDRLIKLTSNIMELNEIDAGRLSLHMSAFDINALLRSTSSLFEETCRKKHITIDLVLSGEVLNVMADQTRIENVLFNLLDNAVKFSPRDSRITLETTEKHNRCYVYVRDEGLGIASGDIPRIWDRFFKSDLSRGKDKNGSGLGLSIARDIITAHGQKISVSSTVDAGSEFYFTLDLAQ